MIGFAITTINVRTAAPNKPPNNEAENAALKALAPWPCLASEKPSRTVACEALDPGIPIKTEVKVSEVGITAIKPINIASAETVSIP